MISHSGVKKADILLILSPDILNLINISELMKGRDSVIIINSPTSIRTGYRTYWVDATGISEKLGLVMAGWHIVSTPILGAFVRVTELVTLDSVISSIGEFVGRGDYVKLNIEAVKMGYSMVKGD